MEGTSSDPLSMRREAAFSLSVFSPEEVFRTRVGRRKVVYLDSNIWIALSDQKTDVARACREACLAAVERGGFIFPTSYASVSELLEHPVERERARQAALMDALSLGVTFRAVPVVFGVEAGAMREWMCGRPSPTPDRAKVFTSVRDQIGNGSVTFPHGWSFADAIRFVEHLRTDPNYRSLAWYVTHLDLASLRVEHLKFREKYTSSMTTALREAETVRREGKLDRERIGTRERAALFHSYVLPNTTPVLLAQLGPEELLRVVRENAARVGEGSPARLKELFAAMPALELCAQIMTARSMNPGRRVQPQDFWDVEHALVAAAYSDVFVTERGTADILENRCSIPAARGCAVLRGVSELASFLRGAGAR